MDIAILHFLQTWILPGCFAFDRPAVYLLGAMTSSTSPNPWPMLAHVSYVFLYLICNV